MKLWFMRLMFKLFVSSGVYGRWSKIYRSIWESKYKDVQLPEAHSFDELADILERMIWRADSVKELGDAFSSPEAVWGKHLNNQSVGDCDDFAAFSSNVILKEKGNGHFKDIVDVHILTVTWIAESGITSGHNVTLLLNDKGQYGVLDYSYPWWVDSIEAAKNFVLHKGRPCIGWAISDCVSLKPLQFGDR